MKTITLMQDFFILMGRMEMDKAVRAEVVLPTGDKE